MGKMANWGTTITFEVSSKKVLTFKRMSRTVSGRWAEHNIVGKSPKYEFTGPGAGQVELTDVILSAEHGVKPRATLDALEKAVRNGTVAYLYVGGKKVGSGKLKLETISETWDEIWNKGELVKATVNLSFSEYR